MTSQTDAPPARVDCPSPTPAQIRKYRRLRGVLLACILGAFVSLVPTAWLFFRSESSPTARAIAVALFIELAVSAAVIGAFAPCPACRARLGTEPGRLLPSRCASGGAQFDEGPAMLGRGRTTTIVSSLTYGRQRVERRNRHYQTTADARDYSRRTLFAGLSSRSARAWCAANALRRLSVAWCICRTDQTPRRG
jgi:hypothetical protein